MCSQIAYKKFPVEKVSYSCVKTIYKNVEKGEKCTTKRVLSLRIGEYDLETVCKKIIKEEPFYENITFLQSNNLLNHMEHALRNSKYHYEAAYDLLHVCFSYCFTPSSYSLKYA